MRGSAVRSLVPLVVVLGLVGMVAVAATGTTPGGTSDGRRPSDYVLDTFFSLALLLLVPGAALLVYGLMQRKAISREIASGRYPRTSMLAFTIFIALFTAAIYWARGHGGLFGWGGTGEVADGGSGDRITARDPSQGDPHAYAAEVAWIPVLLVVALATAAVAAYLIAGRRRPRDVPRGDPASAEMLADVLDETLDDLRGEPDARRAVVAAFARLERALGAVGVPRARTETADEYVARALELLDVPEAAVRRLTVLYDHARFSQHEVDERMRETALDALKEVRDELRLAARRAASGTPGAVPDRALAT